MRYQLGAVSGEYYQTADVRNRHKKVQMPDALNRSIMLYHGCTVSDQKSSNTVTIKQIKSTLYQLHCIFLLKFLTNINQGSPHSHYYGKCWFCTTSRLCLQPEGSQSHQVLSSSSKSFLLCKGVPERHSLLQDALCNIYICQQKSHTQLLSQLPQ